MVSQKMTRKGFTLVELIVVITILAILATIAFLSFQGYSSSARDGKRQSDIASISTKARVLNVNGMAMTTFVVTDAPSVFSGASVAGYDRIGMDTKYAAGNINYTALGLKAADFQDPTTNQSYKMGVSDYAGGVYELAATVEKDGVPTAYVLGNYSPRAGGDVGLVARTADSSVVKLASSASIGLLKAQDNLGATVGTIQAISRDGLTITLSKSLDKATVKLTQPVEGKGLIGSITGVAVEKDTTNIPYAIAN